MVSRDLDSMISARESAAVAAWLKSDKVSQGRVLPDRLAQLLNQIT